MKTKLGISLIVLVITICVMLILATCVILTLNSTNLINQADNAVMANDEQQLHDMASAAWTVAYVKGVRSQPELEAAVYDALKDVDISRFKVTVTTEGVTVEIRDKAEILPNPPADDNEDDEPETVVTKKITLDKAKITEDLKLEESKTVNLTATVENISGDLTWTSSDTSVVTVVGSGTSATVTLLTKGTAIITAKFEEIEAKCNVTVTDWKDSVAMITADGVPIPKGFAVSPYDGEGAKDTGLVIYALTETEIANGVTEIPEGEGYKYSLTNRNQFVWVPVPTASFKTSFRRNMFGDSGGPVTHESKDGYYELLVDSNNMPLGAAYNTWWSEYGLAEAQKMYESVRKYGGFYIGRYEVGASGVDSDNLPSGTLSITMDKYPKNYVARNESETGAITLARAFYPENNIYYGAVSTITYAVQWDRTIAWWKEREPSLSYTNSSAYGNTRDMTFTSSDINVYATPLYARCDYSTTTLSTWNTLTEKTDLDNWLITTGALNKTKRLNIYDMSGSLREWTMERSKFSSFVSRGGSFNDSTSQMFLTRRLNHSTTAASFNIGFRAALYIR